MQTAHPISLYRWKLNTWAWGGNIFWNLFYGTPMAHKTPRNFYFFIVCKENSFSTNIPKF